ncbi:serine/threonine-protein kinase [Streptosporangium carneum]|uniref:non-specific serine/threonine protein kinase n=1 Tax=Streptosporangium carneum TaxID=47481 RepID=A0A9W6MG18_9ACTN|nr:serine/threonine-protein kinase [Streptosporangium carneum]GLK13269.1 serine/threonine protein kinase [Streptosporangium carneum]
MLIAQRYELHRPIGRGGMGELWEGVDVRLNRRVAVKRVRRDRITEESVRRFRREARIMALLRHPGVPTIHDFGEDDYGFFLVMEFVDGWTVTHVLDAHERLSVPWTALIGAQLCAVLSAAHDRSLVHRDLKPGNLMLRRDATLVLLDFGVATVLGSPDFSVITGTLGAPGTDRYTAPEQAYDGRTNALTDLYSVGCVLYEMLTGRWVFQATDRVAEVGGHLGLAPVRPTALLGASVPVELDALVMSLLEKEPDRRPQRADEVFHRLLPFVRDLPPLPGVVDRVRKPIHLYAQAVSQVGW